MAYFIYFGLPLVLLAIGFPIFLILLVTSIVAVLTVSSDIPTDAIQTYMFGSLDNFPLLAVPFFVLAGTIMAHGGIARRIIAMVMAIVGGIRGSLAVTTVAASELFGAMSHTAVGTVVAMGRMIYPSLQDGGYNDRFAVGLIASSGAIAVVIPPSIAMILYAVSAEQSAVQLFTAGILPSLLIGVIDAAFVMTYARLKGVPLGSRAQWVTIWKTSKEASWSIGTLAVIFGGIYGGVFTPTEAAGVAVVYSLFVTMVIYREVDIAGFWRIVMDSAFLISQILLIVDLGRDLFVAFDDQRYPATDRRIDHRDANAALGAAAAPQRRPTHRRKFPRAAGGDPYPDTLAAADCARRRRQRHSLRHHHGGESEPRNVHAAVRIEPVFLASDLQCAVEPDLSRRSAVSVVEFHRADDHHLCTANLDGASASLIFPIRPANFTAGRNSPI